MSIYRLCICVVSRTNERNVIVHVRGTEAGLIGQPSKGRDAGEDGVGLRIVSINIDVQSKDKGIFLPACRRLRAGCCTTDPHEGRRGSPGCGYRGPWQLLPSPMREVLQCNA